MHNEALVASYATRVTHTICLDLSPAGYAAAGPALASTFLIFDAQKCGQKTVYFRFHLLFPTAIERVPGEEEEDHLTTIPSFASLIAATALVEEINIPHPDI